LDESLSLEGKHLSVLPEDKISCIFKFITTYLKTL
jgi:hypothetical protein